MDICRARCNIDRVKSELKIAMRSLATHELLSKNDGGYFKEFIRDVLGVCEPEVGAQLLRDMLYNINNKDDDMARPLLTEALKSHVNDPDFENNLNLLEDFINKTTVDLSEIVQLELNRHLDSAPKTRLDSDEIKRIEHLEDEVITHDDFSSWKNLQNAMEALGVPQQADDPLLKDIIELNEVAFVNQLRAMLFWFRLHARMGVLDAVIKMIRTGEQYTEPSLLNGELETLDINAMKLQLDHLRDFIRDTSVNKNTLEAIVRKEMETMKTIFAQHRRISDEQSSSSDPKECFKDQKVLCGSKRRGPEGASGASDEPPEKLKKYEHRD